MKATIFKTIYAKNEPHQISITRALQRIRDGASRTTVESVRSGNKEDKLHLPAVLFSGEFSSRHDDDIHEHSGFIVLDFDHVEVESTKRALATDAFIYSCWVSPSGTGIKALVKIVSPERHRDHFRALVRYFDERYGLSLDESGINESRACFESFDPDIIIKQSYESFAMLLSEESATAEPEGPTQNFTDYTKLNIAARMVRSAPDGEKHNTLIKAATLCGGYVAAGRMEEDEVVRVLSREIQKRDIDNLEAAISDIKQGIEHGKTRPIRDVVQEEEEAIRRMQIEDGDFSFLSEDDSDFAWIQAYSEGRIPHGLDTGSEEMDKYFRYKKELVILNGHSNVGKTTVALYMIANSTVRHGWKWLIYSAENKTSSIKMQLMQMYLDKRAGSMSYAERKASYKWVQDNFYIINNDKVYSYLDIMLFMEKVKHQYHIDAVFVDPYNSLRLDLRRSEMQNTHDYHYEAATAFLTFSNTHDTAVWLNMHAVTEAQRQKGADGLPRAPYAEDTEGGGKFVNRADCFLTIHRKVQAPDPHTRMMSEIHVRKVRETETGGRPTPVDEPFKMIMNTSHTGFIEWGNQKKMLQAYTVDSGKQVEMPLDSMRFEIGPNENFIRTLPTDEEAEGGDKAKQEA
jgi:replicative DNA helicase